MNPVSDDALPADDAAHLEQQIVVEQLRLYSKHVPSSFLSSAMVSFFLFWYFWGEIENVLLGAWLVFQLATLAARQYQLRAYTHRKLDAATIRAWLRGIHIGVVFSGGIWGVGYLLMSRAPSIDHQVVIAIVIPALCAVAMGTVSMAPRAYPIYMVLMMAPFVATNLSKGNSMGYLLAALGVLFSLTLLSTSKRMTHLLADTLRLGFQNEILRERADASSHAKSAFLSSVSHELRTPLTSIRGFASLIEREFIRSFMPLIGADAALRKKSARIADNLGIILKESERLTRLINDVLDLAKIESGKIEWHDVRIDPAALVRDAANAVQGMFDTKPGVALRCDLPPDLPRICGDADRLQQVLVNLLNNAAKFTARGSVAVAAGIDADGMIRIEVSDTGSGFPPEDAEKIFDKFQQSSQSDTLTDKPKGTGLGLSIAREIVERHGGRIRAASQPGRGSVFTFTLPPADAGESAA